MISNFRGLLNDTIRINAFQRAIDELIDNTQSVLEIGSALGTYSFFAARKNAKKVYAVEMDDIIYAGIAIARKNRLDEKVHFIKGKSTEITLEEKVDYIIMEDYSPFFIYEHLEEVIVDARKRFLKQDGKFIPNKILLKIVPVQSHSFHEEINLWRRQKDTLYGIDWSYTTELAFNRPYYAELHKLVPLTDESLIKTINLSQDSGFPFSFSLEKKVLRDGIIHGLAGWWDSFFTENQYFSNSPMEDSNTWGQMFFPFQYPVKVKKGETIAFQIHALESKYTKNIDFKWTLENNGTRQEQNTLKGGFLPIENQIPKEKQTKRLNTKGQITRFILEKLEQGQSPELIGIQLDEKYSTKIITRDEKTRILNNILKKFI
ncbi:MAG: hypothetical protein JXQ65_08540 [Candidatus Marinimicrobia bacterium]|nr:hypothetical protein [Candidatus Neomarinimicrobiota bacterium]